MSEEPKIISLLKEAKPRQATRNVSLAVAALLVAVAALSITGTYVYMSSRVSEVSMQAGVLEAEKRAALSELDAARAEAARLNSLLLYADRLPLQNVKMKKSGGVLTVDGEVRNAGSRGISDIELTAYFLGEDGKPITDSKYVARSSDGRPLYRYQRRQFRFTVNPAPEDAKDIALVITRVDFE